MRQCTFDFHSVVKPFLSERAREKRALAAERRLLALQGGSKGQRSMSAEYHTSPYLFEPDVQPTSQSVPGPVESQENSNDEVEIIEETNADQRRALLDSEQNGDEHQKLNADDDSSKPFQDESRPEEMPTVGAGSSKTSSDRDVFEILFSGREEGGQACDIPVPPGSTLATGNIALSSQGGTEKLISNNGGEEDGQACNVPIPSGSTGNIASSSQGPGVAGKLISNSGGEEDGQAYDIPIPSGSTLTTRNIVSSSSSSDGKVKPSRSKQSLGLRKIIQHKINFRKGDSRGHMLGTTTPSTEDVSGPESSGQEGTCCSCLVC